MTDTQQATLASWLLGCIAADEAIGEILQRSSLGEDRQVFILAVCKAHRAIVELHPQQPTDDDPTVTGCRTCNYDGDCSWQYESNEPGGCYTLRALAQAYSDRPGFRPEWNDESASQPED